LLHSGGVLVRGELTSKVDQLSTDQGKPHAGADAKHAKTNAADLD